MFVSLSRVWERSVPSGCVTPQPAPTVVLADDEQQLLDLMGRILERAGYRVLSARDGDRALELFRGDAGRVAAVVLDVTIPPSGAVSVLRQMCAEQPGLGVVLISGSPPAPEAREILNASGGIFVPKPFSPSVLTRALDEARAGSAA